VKAGSPERISNSERHGETSTWRFIVHRSSLPPVPADAARRRGLRTMKWISLIVIVMAVAAVGCSWVTSSERANLTKLQSREEYITEHPGGAYNPYIRNGEITKGMSTHEVLASWGYPNTYITSQRNAREHWIYYVQNEDSQSYMIYTLNFSGESLEGWSIDIKRFDDYGSRGSIVLSRESLPESKRVLQDAK
jgi:hypothetical protein